MNKETFTRIIKYGGMGVIAMVIAPFVFLAIQGIVGAAIAIVIAGILHALMPAFSTWLGQLKYGAMKVVISRAPVEALIARASERAKALQEQAQLLKAQGEELATFKRKTLQFMRDYPEDAPQMQEKLDGYEKLFALRMDMFKQAKADAVEFGKKVDKAEAVYDMAMADAKLSKSFGKQKDFDAFFREKVAFEAIERASDASMASLSMALLDDDLVAKVKPAETHAIKYDANHNVVTGNILNVPNVVQP